MEGPLVDVQELIRKRDAALEAADAIVNAAADETRALTDEERETYEAHLVEAGSLRSLLEARQRANDERANRLPDLHEARNIGEGETRDGNGDGTDGNKPAARSMTTTLRDPGTYTPRSERSWFVDKVDAEVRNDPAARERLVEADAFVRQETREGRGASEQRDLYIGSTTGQELAPPIYLQNLFVEGRIAGAVAAGLCNRLPLPPAGRTVTIPKLTGNTAVGIQTEASTLTALTETDATFGDETQGIYEIAGVQDLSNYLAERSTPGADMIIMRNLAAQLAAKEDYYVLHGDGTGEPQGIRGATGINAVTWTESTPTFAEAQAVVGNMVSQIAAGWLEMPDAIIAHPRRAMKWATERDSTGRNLIAPVAVASNPTGVGSPFGGAQGFTGFTLHGVPVYADANVLATSGAGTNEDTIFAMVRAQALLWLGDLKLEIDRSINFKTSGVAIRARQYMAFMCEHAPEAFGTVTGTGLVTPTFE